MNKASVFPTRRALLTYLTLKLLVARFTGRWRSKLGATYFKGRGVIFKNFFFFGHFLFLNNAK